MKSALVLERLYRLPPYRPTLREWLARVPPRATLWVQENTKRLCLVSLGVGTWIVAHVHYYNLLVNLESNVVASRAQIEVLQQKRDHVRRDLTQLMHYHASYERSVMKELTGLRAKQPHPSGESLQELVMRLDAVAEQYPNLNLGKTADQFSQLITATETEIAQRIVAYNDAVNVYSTTLNQFPANVFGKPLGFKLHPYFRAEDAAALRYKEVQP